MHHARVLLVRRRVSEGTLSWQFPAGKVEGNETPFQTAVRETVEETGLHTTPLAVLGSRQHPATGRHITYVACETSTGDAILAAPDEIAELQWCCLEQLRRLIPTGVFAPVAACLQQHLA